MGKEGAYMRKINDMTLLLCVVLFRLRLRPLPFLCGFMKSQGGLAAKPTNRTWGHFTLKLSNKHLKMHLTPGTMSTQEPSILFSF